MKNHLRANSVIKGQLNSSTLDFLEMALGSITRILPHVEISGWQEEEVESAPSSPSVTRQNSNTEIRITIPVSKNRILQTTASRISLTSIARTLQVREYDLCKEFAFCLFYHLQNEINQKSSWVNKVSSSYFDEQIIVNYLSGAIGTTDIIHEIFEHLHKISEQTYENKSLSFGLIVDTNSNRKTTKKFPKNFLQYKRYKALSDGFRTAYLISKNGSLENFIDLEISQNLSMFGGHYYPDWVGPLARSCSAGKIGFALTRQGDILVFIDGTIQFTYRFGKWQFWNHSYLIKVLTQLCRAQKVSPAIVGKVTNTIYRAALSVSFRRSGALFVILRNKRKINQLVRDGDAINDKTRDLEHSHFDAALPGKTIQGIPQPVLAEIAGLDGACVVSNSGELLAYASVLHPKSKRGQSGSEGSRTKAAIGASYLGISVKISSDGDITVFQNGRQIITI